MLFGLFLIFLVAATVAALTCTACGVTFDRVAPRLAGWLGGSFNNPTDDAVRRQIERNRRALVAYLERLQRIQRSMEADVTYQRRCTTRVASFTTVSRKPSTPSGE